ncbi:MAG: RecB family exonuclease [Nanoarchaeota archaeon]
MVKIFSHSRLKTFEQCPLKFKYKYIDKIKPEFESSIESHLGKCVHDSLEWIYNSVKKEKIPSIDEVIKYYSVRWEETWKEDTKIVKNHLNIKDYFNKGVEFLLNYYMKHQPFKDGTIDCERKIIIELDKENGYHLQGFIDRLVYNKETGEYEVHDYKTANNLPSREDVEKDRQLALYSIAIKEIFGRDKDVCLVWHYLAHNTKICIKKTNEDLRKLKKDVLELINKIENAKDFPPCKSILCNWCEYKSMCPVFGGKLNERQQKIEDCRKNEQLNENIEKSEEIQEETNNKTRE